VKYFIELAKTKHVTRASERLGVTQPTLSHCLKRIEDELGVQLFVRSKRGIELTAAGLRFYDAAVELQDQWSHLVQSVQDELDLPKGLIKVGCHPAVASYTLPAFLPKLTNMYPNIRIQLQHGLSRHVTEDVISLRLDVALAVNPTPNDDLIIKEVCRDMMTLWRPKQNRKTNTLLLDPNLLQSQEILKKLGKWSSTFSNHIESSSLEVITQLLHAGVGYAILPKRVVESVHTAEVEMVKNAPIVHDRVCLVFKPEFRKTKRGRTFIDIVEESFI
ncbi:MAG: LysR family transcriptional regulator, partial [Bdellovibrionales bacterium]|nr:LysR family transcriptional regulator [Bdellovibrionales bacterium]